MKSIKNTKWLQSYVDRVGATQINFRKFIIKEYSGNYYLEKTIISLDAEGTISCSNEQYAPTKEEREAIKYEMKDLDFPKQIEASLSNVKALEHQLDHKSILYRFYNFERSKIIMVQEKRFNKNGTKSYIPWSFFSDGEWRSLEPDDGLPFWKPKKQRHKTNRSVIIKC